MVGSVLWFIYQYKQNQELKNIVENFSENKQQNLTPPPTFSTSTLKTYRNTEWGFEFQYPKNWSFEINSFHSPFSKFNLQGNTSDKNYNPLNPAFMINVVTPDFIERQFSDLKNTASKTSVGGVDGEKYEYHDEFSEVTVILPFGQYNMIIGTEKPYAGVFNQILATFKFLSKVQTYRNIKFGYEFQYSSNLILKEMDFPDYIFTDSGKVCKNLFEEESKHRRVLNQTSLVDPSTKFKVEIATVSVYENSDNLSLDDWLNSGTKFLEKYLEECKYDDKNYIEIRLNDKKNVTIDNTPGVVGFSGCCEVSNKNIYLIKNNKIYELSFSGSVNNDLKCIPFLDNKYSCPTISEDVYNQILATFKFLK